MKRKKWTPKNIVTPTVLKFREKRKWQLALRRYVIEKNLSEFYAPYFGLDINGFREWIEIQFSDDLHWNNFGKSWQFAHLVPVNYFDFSDNNDLLICWNFINIRVETIQQEGETYKSIDLIAVRPYFQALYNNTGYSVCLKMIQWLERFENVGLKNKSESEKFILGNKSRLEQLTELTQQEYKGLNMGGTLKDVFLQREIIRKFG